MGGESWLGRDGSGRIPREKGVGRVAAESAGWMDWTGYLGFHLYIEHEDFG